MWESGCNRSGGVGRRLVSTVDQGGSAEIRSSGTMACGGGIQPVSFVYGSGGDGGHLLCRLTRRRHYWAPPVLSPPLWPAGCCSPNLHHHRSMPVWRSAHRRRRGGGQGDAVLTYVQRARPVHTAASCGSPPTSVAPPPPFFAVRGGSWAFAGAARWQGSHGTDGVPALQDGVGGVLHVRANAGSDTPLMDLCSLWLQKLSTMTATSSWAQLVMDLYPPGLSSRDWTCSYCRVIQPPRTRHCHDCDKCVLQFDHHCIWLGTCIGKKNHCPFWVNIPDSTPLSTGVVYCTSRKVKAILEETGPAEREGYSGEDMTNLETFKGKDTKAKGYGEPLEKWRAKGQRDCNQLRKGKSTAVISSFYHSVAVM